MTKWGVVSVLGWGRDLAKHRLYGKRKRIEREKKKNINRGKIHGTQMVDHEKNAAPRKANGLGKPEKRLKPEMNVVEQSLLVICEKKARRGLKEKGKTPLSLLGGHHRGSRAVGDQREERSGSKTFVSPKKQQPQR